MKLDAPATGHGVAILKAPRTFAEVGAGGPIARQGRISTDALRPARTGIVAVARPEEMPVNETLALEDALRDAAGMSVDLVVANGMLPRALTADQAAALGAANEASPEIRAHSAPTAGRGRSAASCAACAAAARAPGHDAAVRFAGARCDLPGLARAARRAGAAL